MNSLIKLAVVITKICSLITSKIWKQHFYEFKIKYFVLKEEWPFQLPSENDRFNSVFKLPTKNKNVH